MSQPQPLQEKFLNHIRKHKVRVSLFLVNGVKLQGVVLGFDLFSILLGDSDNRVQLIYKNAVSTIVPTEAIPRLGGEDAETATEE